MIPATVSEAVTDYLDSLSSTNAWRRFETIRHGDYKGLPARHLRIEDVDADWVGATIVVSEQSAELPRTAEHRWAFNRNFNATLRVLNRTGRLVGEYAGSIGSQWRYTSGGVRSGLYYWRTHRHNGQYAALTVTTDGQSRADVPMQGVNNNNPRYRGRRLADEINVHASGRRTRSSSGCMNIDRRNGDDETYLRFMSHFPQDTSGALLVFRHHLVDALTTNWEFIRSFLPFQSSSLQKGR